MSLLSEIRSLFSKDKELEPQELKKTPSEFYFNVEHFNVVSIEYDYDLGEISIEYFLVPETLWDCSVLCSYNTYLEHKERFEKKIETELKREGEIHGRNIKQ